MTAFGARDQLRVVLKIAEGTGPVTQGRLFPYRDCCGRRVSECRCTRPGKITIGYGRNLEDVGISFGEADELLEDDVDDAIRDAVARGPWIADLDPVRQATLVELEFNLGSRLAGFVVFLAAAKRGDWPAAGAALADSLAAREAPSRYARLRRQIETGKWS